MARAPMPQWLLKEGPTLNGYDFRFTQRTIKVVFDGALGSRGAALLKPYSDAPDTSGFFTAKESDLRPLLEEALRRGIQVETHAIGDRANRTILDLYEQAFKSGAARAKKGARAAVAGGACADSERAKTFRVSRNWASFRPCSHPTPSATCFSRRAVCGKERLAGAYAWQSLLKSGAIIAGGSDAPVERGEPMIEFYAAVARKSVKGFSGDGWHPEQAVSREQALKMFTAWPAYAAFEEKDKGSIEVGKLADLTVLSKDIMKIPEPEILTTTCAMTVIGGEIVFERPN